MRNLAPRLLALFLLSTPVALVGCANCGGDDAPDGSVRDGSIPGRRDTGIRRLPDGRVVAEDGSVPPGGSTDPCGSSGERCCRSGACDLGLRCDSADSTCRSRAGGAPCTTGRDCSTGLVCEMGDCRVPDGSSCIGSSDCRMGRACIGGTCEEPTDGCGAAGGMCCTGDVCRSGMACTGTTCEACGADGQPCCDGSTSCGFSTALLCLSGTCETPDGCGTDGTPCCRPDDACVRGSTCTGGSCVADPAPGSTGSGCGADGDPCCEGEVCAFGSICEPFLTHTCIGIETIGDFLDFDCGEEGELCCIWDTSDGISLFTCEGDLECDFLFCSGSCSSPSEICTGSDSCCDTALCKPAPFTPRCCVGPGERCAGSLECCGWMLCGDDDTCQCQATGSACIEDSECCDGGICRLGTCAPSNMCEGPREPCMDDSQCCRGGGLRCEVIIASEMEEQKKCCAGSEAGCRDSQDCCGWMLCEDGECACQGADAFCEGDEECCDGHICVLGTCAVDTGMCGRVGEACDIAEPTSCCGISRCQNIGSATGPTQCCGRPDDTCEINSECCGMMECGTDGQCEARTAGQSCLFGENCDGSLICNRPTTTMAGTCE